MGTDQQFPNLQVPPGGNFPVVHPEEKVKWPAIGLLVTSALCALLTFARTAPFVVLAVVGLASGKAEESMIFGAIGAVGMIVGVGIVALNCLVAWGAWQMMNGERYQFALISSIVAITPMTGCCLITLPFGVWGLVVLQEQPVKDWFRS